jgi:UDP-N-acetylmuramate--alanine ligase
MFAKLQRVHFVGIGGIGMSGIAEVLLNLGYKISGSDLKRSAVTERLAGMGAQTFEEHVAENVTGADVVVTSSAIMADNPEVVEARRQHIPVIQRAEMLAELMLAAGGLDPTVVVGGRVDALGSNARLGKSQYLVAEADESDRSFLKLSPILSIVTNIDREHMDCYRNMRDVKRTFVEFMDRVPFYGMIVACNDDVVLRKLLAQVRRRVLTYGTRRGSDFLIKVQRPEAVTNAESNESTPGQRPRSRFRVQYRERDLGDFTLHVPGLHNVLNATAAIAVGIGLDIPADQIRTALETFRGVDRRFQLRGEAGGISVIDDYGHHPTEIRATLAAARECGYRKIHVIFQPHRFTRTQELMDEFATAFNAADTVCVLDIYAASEKPIEGVSGERLAEKIADGFGRKEGHSEIPAVDSSVRYVRSFAEAVEAVTTAAEPGDMILTLGAGSVSQVGPMIVEKLQSHQSLPA